MARIVLIDPRGWQGAVGGYSPSPNIGIAYLVPVLRRHGHCVSVIDLNNEPLTHEQVLQQLEAFAPDVVGFSAKTATMKDARCLAKAVKTRWPAIPVILGGPHTTIAWEKLVDEPCFDVIFVGEGEQKLALICERLVSSQMLTGIPGVLTRSLPMTRVAAEGPLVAASDLNTLPWPDYDLFPENVRRSLQSDYPLLTSRGCVYKCTFCSVPEISGSGFRKRSPESILAELRYARERYGTTNFWIVDDVFNLDMKRCKEFCRMLIEADLGMTWYCPNGLRADRVDTDLARLMYRAGCRRVNVGIESVTPSILATVQKGETIEQIEKGVSIFMGAGLQVTGFFIIGLPGDSIEAEIRSVEFVQRLGINAHFNLLVPYPGTSLWDWANKHARFLADPEDGIHFRTDTAAIRVVVETDDFTAAERIQAYEMVHTRLKNFNMLIPRGLPAWRRNLWKMRLLWRWDRAHLFAFPQRRLAKIRCNRETR